IGEFGQQVVIGSAAGVGLDQQRVLALAGSFKQERCAPWVWCWCWWCCSCPSNMRRPADKSSRTHQAGHISQDKSNRIGAIGVVLFIAIIAAIGLDIGAARTHAHVASRDARRG